MRMLKKYSGNLYCFSPPVMLFTLLFEFSAALYVIWRYKADTLTRLVVAMLLALGTFQLAEYMICGGLGVEAPAWARLGYVSITLLPVLGIHMIVTLAGKKAPLLVYGAYASMAAFAVYFALAPGVINDHECRPNYAVFTLDDVSVVLYSLYYYGWLIAAVLLTAVWSRGAALATALRCLGFGYLLFMVPTVTITLLYPQTMAGIPSIMCGFAVLLAVILVIVVLPNSHSKKRNVSP